jgi:hypothetical protein
MEAKIDISISIEGIEIKLEQNKRKIRAEI